MTSYAMALAETFTELRTPSAEELGGAHPLASRRRDLEQRQRSPPRGHEERLRSGGEDRARLPLPLAHGGAIHLQHVAPEPRRRRRVRPERPDPAPQLVCGPGPVEPPVIR